MVPCIVFGVAVSEGIPVVGSGVDAPSVTPEIGFGIENDFAGDAVPVILFILGDFFEDEADSFFVACHVERGGTEAVFAGHNFVHAVGGGIFVGGLDGESLNGVRVFNDGTVENFGNMEIAVIGNTDVVSGDVAELFGDNGEFFNQFKFLGEHFVTAFRFFAGEPADVSFDEGFALIDQLLAGDTMGNKLLFIIGPTDEDSPDGGDTFAVDALLLTEIFGFCGGSFEVAVKIEHKIRRGILPFSDETGGGFLRIFGDTFADQFKILVKGGIRFFSVIIADEELSEFFGIFIGVNEEFACDIIVEHHEVLRLVCIHASFNEEGIDTVTQKILEIGLNGIKNAFNAGGLEVTAA